MNIQVEQSAGPTAVAIMRLQGDLDGASYRDLIARGKELYAAGHRRLLIDLSGTPYMSSSGVVALHTLALLYRGADAPDPETEGWRALRAVGEAPSDGAPAAVRLLNPSPRVAAVLEQVGLQAFFPAYTDQAVAVASF